MAPPQHDPKTAWRALILDLALPSEDAARFLTVVEQADPSHGLRAAMANYHDVLAHLQPAAVPAFDAYVNTLPKHPPFSFMPIIEYAARFLKAAVLAFPGRPLVESVNALSEVNAGLLNKTPMTQAVVKAAEGDPRAFFRNFNRDSQLVTNFGYREADIDAPNRFRVLYRDSYPLFSMYYLVGAAQGTCACFKDSAQASFEPVNDTDFFIDIRW